MSDDFLFKIHNNEFEIGDQREDDGTKFALKKAFKNHSSHKIIIHAPSHSCVSKEMNS